MDVVRARLVCLGLQLHSLHAISQERSRGESFQEIVVRATMGWLFDPVPVAAIPTGMRMLMEQTFDWGFWLLLMLFADYFGVPEMAPHEVERLFSDESGARMYPADAAGQKVLPLPRPLPNSTLQAKSSNLCVLPSVRSRALHSRPGVPPSA
tara:strand:- start:284 stop:739 length:456 start_codon:yes stop_codon:yes gene_type:complete